MDYPGLKNFIADVSHAFCKAGSGYLGFAESLNRNLFFSKKI